MRLTIERLRTLVLVAAVVLIASIIAALALGKWKRHFIKNDIPTRLGLNITQEADGFTFSHAMGSHSQYRIHAARVVQLRDNRAQLHDVTIDLFDNDGNHVDRIVGTEFDYDPAAGTARADGPVEITMMRPGSAPSVAPKASAGEAGKSLAKPLTAVAQNAASGEIHVKTSGLSFDRNTGSASTDKPLNFTTNQGTGSAVGATYEAQQGLLTLDHAVELHTQRNGTPVTLHARHAVFERTAKKCHMQSVMLETENDQVTTGDAILLFRDDGSAIQLDATQGFTLSTQSGSRIAAASGHLSFDERNQPRNGQLEGGVTLSSHSSDANSTRNLHGSSPQAQLEFNQKGILHLAHLERGVEMQEEEQRPGSELTTRNWRSPVADMQFNDVKGQVQLASIQGSGGVVLQSESHHGQGQVVPSRLSADSLSAVLSNEKIQTLIGSGHAALEQTTANGTRQSTSGDHLEAHFQPSGNGRRSDLSDLQNAIVDGHVVLTQQAQGRSGSQPMLRATANHAVYDGAGSQLHLTQSPRIENGGLQMTADRIDVSQSNGEAWAHGNVKATWTGANGSTALPMGGTAPTHVIAGEAHLQQSSGEVSFRNQARLWQDANSILAPVIVLNRTQQTLAAFASGGAEPVRLTMASTGGKSGGNNLIRLRGGELHYRESDRRALLEGGTLGSVTAESTQATSVSREIELILLPTGKSSKNGQVDRMIARGHVVLTTEGRRGSGEQLVYNGQTGEYVLTGTNNAPPRITDATHGTITGESVHFSSKDDSVTVEGGKSGTVTETRTPR